MIGIVLTSLFPQFLLKCLNRTSNISRTLLLPASFCHSLLDFLCTNSSRQTNYQVTKINGTISYVGKEKALGNVRGRLTN